MTDLIGRSVRRQDGDAKVRGAFVYGIDHEEPRMLHACLLRSPVASGRVAHLDVVRAAAMPGVAAVLTAADAPRRGGWIVEDQTLFADGLVRYAGEPLAAVAAESYEQARDAVGAIAFEIEPLPVVAGVHAAADRRARLIHPEWASYVAKAEGERHGNVAFASTLEWGDVAAGFAAAAHVVEDEYVVPRQAQVPLEPHATVARHAAGRFVIHTCTQFPFNVRERVAGFLGVRPSAVRIVGTGVGGGFGGKLDALLEPYAALLARRAGRPVRLVNTRREEMTTAPPREGGHVQIRTAVADDGELLAREATVLMDNGAYAGESPANVSVPGLVLASNYRLGAIRLRSELLYTNTTPTGAFRGIAGPWLTFALERHMDHIAAVVGADRRAFRMRHVYRDGDDGPTGQPLPDVAFVEGFERVERIAPWAQASARGPYRGVGQAVTMWTTNPGASSILLKLNDDGTVGVVTAGAEIGTGAIAAGVTQVVADALDVRPEDVIVLAPDTDAAGFDAGAQGSRTLALTAPAVDEAATAVRAQILEVAEDLLEADARDLELRDGTVRVIGSPDSAIALGDIAAAALDLRGPIQASGRHVAAPTPFDGSCMAGMMIPAWNAPSFSVHQAEVEVDPDTGHVRILRYVVAQDVGRVINPLGIESQIQGAVMQGIGYALYEALRIGADGICLDQDLESYRLPTAFEVPPLEVSLMEHPVPGTPLGAKGVAEPPIVPVAAAIANAVSDAVGAPFDTLPITPFAVLAALRERGRARS